MAKVRSSVCVKDGCGLKLTTANAGPRYGTMCEKCEGPHIAKCDREMAAIKRWVAERKIPQRRQRKVCLDATRAGAAVDTGEAE